MQIPEQILQQFEDEKLWGGGPLLELILVFEKEEDLYAVDKSIQSTNLFQLLDHDTGPYAKHYLFNFATNKFIGAHLSHRKSARDLSGFYTVSIRPIQVKNEIGSTLDSKLTFAQKTALTTLLRSLIDLVEHIRKEYKLRYATLNTEEDGRASILTKLPDGLYIGESLGKHYGYVSEKNSSIGLLCKEFLGTEFLFRSS
ncbi:MAG: hypothetical protein IPG59_10470 [Candidatus Melainabacteria bacterium]|nr:MAG: hypothetical protein IPG59_10470 [Candidatus Melainabacteria bacterium]